MMTPPRGPTDATLDVIALSNRVKLAEASHQRRDNAAAKQKTREKDAMRRKLKRFLKYMDEDGSDDLSFQEFMTIASDPNVKRWLVDCTCVTFFARVWLP